MGVDETWNRPPERAPRGDSVEEAQSIKEMRLRRLALNPTGRATLRPGDPGVSVETIAPEEAAEILSELGADSILASWAEFAPHPSVEVVKSRLTPGYVVPENGEEVAEILAEQRAHAKVVLDWSGR